MRRSSGPVALLRGRLRPGDDTGSLAMALLLTLVGVGLSALLVPMVVTQLRTTQATVQRTDALNAAQAGLDVTLGRIRAATDGTTNPDGSLTGTLADLPCYQDMPGSVSDTVSYTVTVSYFDEQGNPIKCAQGFGAERTPATATLNATGTAGSATRTLQATYRFATSNEPIPGGLIYLAGNTNLCLEANSATSVPTWFVRVATCDASSVQQQFAYDKNLNIYLVSTRNSSQGVLGACLTEMTGSGNPPPLAFQPCSTTTQVTQQWQFNASANFQSADNYCFYAASTAVGTAVTLKSCSSGGTGFSPDASVGAGAAGPSTGQLVNFQQFGRCLDVTNQNVNTNGLIIWPCKQSISSAPDWNQVWHLPSSSGNIYTMPTSSSKYCLRSPGSTAPGRYVTVVPSAQCGTGGTTWTVRGDTHDYTTSFRIEDSFGFCLSGSGAPDYFSSTGGQNISYAVVAPCTGSTLEKWNADPRVLKSSPLTDLTEK